MSGLARAVRSVVRVAFFAALLTLTWCGAWALGDVVCPCLP